MAVVVLSGERHGPDTVCCCYRCWHYRRQTNPPSARLSAAGKGGAASRAGAIESAGLSKKLTSVGSIQCPSTRCRCWGAMFVRGVEDARTEARWKARDQMQTLNGRRVLNTTQSSDRPREQAGGFSILARHEGYVFTSNGEVSAQE